MKLCYRGVQYDYNPPSLEVTEGEILGNYRGRPVNFSYVRHVPFPQPVGRFQYRGSQYQTNTQGQREPIAGQSAYVMAMPKRTQANASPTMAARRQLVQEAARAHRENIRRSIEQRLTVAREQGNNRLVELLEQEKHQVI
ncbi:hypothetical protein C7271_07130 [filamentous cyanobacterium CCP5]|nr:hypothetical protein C7271_07130 [filamentous cyanobacterium CCP5]